MKIYCNDYVFTSEDLSGTEATYKIVHFSDDQSRVLKNKSEILICEPREKFPIGRDLKILTFQKVAYFIAGGVLFIAGTSLPICLIVYLGSGSMLLKTVGTALVVVSLSSRAIVYLERQLREKNFEIANKVICTLEKRDQLYPASDFK